jgi:hypothetical protein
VPRSLSRWPSGQYWVALMMDIRSGLEGVCRVDDAGARAGSWAESAAVWGIGAKAAQPVPTITRAPAGVAARAVILLSDTKEASPRPCTRSHTRIVRSLPPETAWRPSALTATVWAGPWWPGRTCAAAPESRSDTRTIRVSPEAEVSRMRAS